MVLRKKAAGEDQWLQDSIREARSEWTRAENCFNEVTDQELVDYASYAVMAARTRYMYLINLAKKKNEPGLPKETESGQV
ncbi:MAG: DUF2508 family protein [Firmicutes bacterium]|nr:DUF2508 family protein [Bacillota bacterium]